jgi:hypothetical protein
MTDVSGVFTVSIIIALMVEKASTVSSYDWLPRRVPLTVTFSVNETPLYVSRDSIQGT